LGSKGALAIKKIRDKNLLGGRGAFAIKKIRDKIFWGATTINNNIRITMRMRKSNKKRGNDL